MGVRMYVGDFEKNTNKFTPSGSIEVRRSKKYGQRSRAVYATKDIEPGKVIEACPVIRMPNNEVFHPTKEWPTISNYCFDWHDENGKPFTALVLGYGSLYNHSGRPNAYFRYRNGDCLEFVAYRQIKAGEEITINYNGDPEGREDWQFGEATFAQ